MYLVVILILLALSLFSARTQTVDSSTLSNKFMLGYQAWHACQGDGSPVNKYIHWGHADNARPSTNDVPAQVVSHLQTDWAYLTSNLQITNSSRYLRHKGKPVVAVWGLGLTGVAVPTNDAQTIVNFFKSAGCTVMGGVPYWWRALNN